MNSIAIKRVGRYLVKNTVILLFLVYFVAALIFIPNFANPDSLKSIFTQSSFLVILSLGLTFVFVNAGIDFSIIGILGLSSILGASIMKNMGTDASVVLAIIVMLGIGVGVGCLNGLSVTKLRMPSFVATMATQMIFCGLALWYTQSTSIAQLPDSFLVLGQADVGVIPVPVIFAIIITILSFFLMNLSAFGRNLMAVGTNQKAARVAGIPVKKTIFTVFIISGVFASISSILMTSKTATGSPSLGSDLIMDIVSAVVVGGTSVAGGRGSVIGTAVGAVFVTMLRSSLYLVGLEWFMINIFLGAMVLAVAVVDVFQRKRLRIV